MHKGQERRNVKACYELICNDSIKCVSNTNNNEG